MVLLPLFYCTVACTVYTVYALRATVRYGFTFSALHHTVRTHYTVIILGVRWAYRRSV